MGGNDERGTARIYDLSAFRRRRIAPPAASAVKAVPVTGGGAWYHEAAIRDEDRTRRP